jgi:hypothetical protein
VLSSGVLEVRVAGAVPGQWSLGCIRRATDLQEELLMRESFRLVGIIAAGVVLAKVVIVGGWALFHTAVVKVISDVLTSK